jgi:hypothetical protein
MKNIKKVLFIVLILLISIVGIVYAEEIPAIDPPVVVEEIIPAVPDPVTIHLTITTNDGALYDQNINVNACNSDNASTIDVKVTAYCAILQSGIQNDWNWDWAPGAFLNSLGDIAGYTSKDKDDNDVYHYWSWSSNGTEGMTGLNQYDLQINDLISLTFIDPIEPTPEIPPSDPAEEQHSSSGSRSVTREEKKVFDLKKAFEFIISQQKENGSFGEDIYTDWVALSVATTPDYKTETIKLIKHLGELKISGTLLTDFERHAMALMALGLSPYNTNGENYIEKIIASFDGKQFGNSDETNDDIFALIVLQNAGYNMEDKIISDDISFILNAQEKDGSWNKSVDMTGASIEALSAFSTTPGVKESLEKAKNFLKENQKENGSWNDNASSTAWALQGILGMGEKIEDWKNGGNAPLDYLATLQDTDGGVKGENLQNKIWETTYVISSLSGKSWNQIMQKFEKPTISVMADIEKNPAQKQEIKKISKKSTLPASVITAVTQSPATTQTQKETPKKSWFMRLMSTIFNVF